MPSEKRVLTQEQAQFLELIITKNFIEIPYKRPQQELLNQAGDPEAARDVLRELEKLGAVTMVPRGERRSFYKLNASASELYQDYVLSAQQPTSPQN